MGPPGRTADSFEQRVRAQEETGLSPLAVRSFETRGRLVPEEPCSVRTPFQRDRDRLVHSKPFRRLKGKTQVFIDPEGDHYRTRMTHTLETTAISRVVARALRLNEDLVEAIGLGHDTGHTPFGHAGEQALDDALNASFGRRFRHNEQSLRIARRLNLTHEVCDGILTHTGVQEPETLEGKVVRVVDRVAYINHDIDDAIRYGILAESDLPHAEIELLGATGSERIDRLVHDLVETSEDAGDIRQSDEIGEAMLSLRAFMFDRVYLGPQVGPEHRRAHDVLRAIFVRLVDDPDLLPPGEGDLPERITDYVSGMTDRFALAYVGGSDGADQGQERPRRHRRVEHRRGRRPANVAAQELGHALHGALPVPRGAIGELLGQLRPQPLSLLRLRQGRRRRHVRPRDRGPRLRRRDRVAR